MEIEDVDSDVVVKICCNYEHKSKQKLFQHGIWTATNVLSKIPTLVSRWFLIINLIFSPVNLGKSPIIILAPPGAKSKGKNL